MTKRYLPPAVVDTNLHDYFHEVKDTEEYSATQVLSRAIDKLIELDKLGIDTQYQTDEVLSLRLQTSKITAARFNSLDKYCEKHQISRSQGVRNAVWCLQAK